MNIMKSFIFFFYGKGDGTLKLVAQRAYGVSNLENIPNPTGHSPENPALFDPALSRGIRQGDLQRSLPTSPFLYF